MGLFKTDEIRKASFGVAKGMVRQNLIESNEWLVRALMALFERQTEDEKRVEATRYLNRRGFNSADSVILTSFAKQWQRREWVSDKQLGIMRRKLLKYSAQLCRIARGEEEKVAA